MTDTATPPPADQNPDSTAPVVSAPVVSAPVVYTPVVDPPSRPERLYRVATGFGIAAAAVVIAAVVFGTGFCLGKQDGIAQSGEVAQMVESRPGQMPFGRFDRPGFEVGGPNHHPGPPQSPEGVESPHRPSETPSR
ncbi:MAG: hypothetical protein ACSLE6_01830 [Mycobacterium sp.]